MLEGPPVELQQVDRVDAAAAARLRSTPARTIAGVIGPGVGHHLVKTAGRAAPRRRARAARKRPAMTSALP